MSEQENGTVKRAKKLAKAIEGTVVKITVSDGSNVEKLYDFATLPESIQAKLGPFGLGHKLGDAAAGKSGTDAEDAIDKVWEGLMAEDWSVRAPAAPKVTTKDVLAKLSALPEDQQTTAKALLSALGINLPGM